MIHRIFLYTFLAIIGTAAPLVTSVPIAAPPVFDTRPVTTTLYLSTVTHPPQTLEWQATTLGDGDASTRIWPTLTMTFSNSGLTLPGYTTVVSASVETQVVAGLSYHPLQETRVVSIN